jgi:hypothetical protein
MRAKRIVQTGIMLGGLIALPAMSQTTAPEGGTTTSPPVTHEDRGFDFGWLGLLGLAGLLGLRRHGHRTDTTTGRIDTR